MARLKLHPDPTFKAKVAISVAGAGPAHVEFTFKHRTRQEMDRFLESVKDMTDDVEMILAMTSGWDLSDEFSEQNVRQLVDGYIQAPAAIFDVYLQELSGNRRKN